MNSDDTELLNLEPDIEKARKHYFRSRDHMRLALKEMGANEDAADKLFSLAEEFGIEHVAERLVDSGREIGFQNPYSVAKGESYSRVIDLLSVAKEADTELCSLVAAREDILCARDPSRARRYNIDGQDVTFNVRDGKVRVMDGDREEPLRIELIAPTGFPERSLASLRKDRNRNDDRY